MCVLYTIPMNINGYILFLINTLGTIIRGLICCTLHSRRLPELYLMLKISI